MLNGCSGGAAIPAAAVYSGGASASAFVVSDLALGILFAALVTVASVKRTGTVPRRQAPVLTTLDHWLQ